MLEADAVAGMLIDSGLLTAEDVVDREIEFVDVSRSNRVHLVRIDAVTRYVAKQGQPAKSPFHACFDREAAVYRHAVTSPAIARLMPQCHNHRSDLRLLVIEFINGTPVWSAEADGTVAIADLVCRLGALLGVLHRETVGIGGFDASLPWVLSLFDADAEAFVWSHPDMRPVLERASARPHFVDDLRRGRGLWRPTCLIHGDVKFDNCLLTPTIPDDGALDVKMIDWELAVYGDPAWDLACLLENVLVRHFTSSSDGNAEWPAWATAMAKAALEAHRAEYPGTDAIARRLPIFVAVCLFQTALRYATMTQEDREAYSAPVEPLVAASAEIFRHDIAIAADLDKALQ